MKIHEYNEMMSYLTRPAQPIDRLNKAIGGGVIEGEDLGTREGFVNPGISTQAKRLSKVKNYLDEETFVKLRKENKNLTNAQFAEFLNTEGYKPDPRQAEKFKEISIDRRYNAAKKKGLFPKTFRYAGDAQSRLITDKDRAEYKKYVKKLYKNNPEKLKQILALDDKAINKKISDRRKAQKVQADPEKRQKKIDAKRQYDFETKTGLRGEEAQRIYYEKIADNNRFKKKDANTFFRNVRDGKTLLWEDLLKRTAVSKDSPFKLNKKLTKGKRYDKTETQKFVLTDKQGNKFTFNNLIDDIAKAGYDPQEVLRPYEQKAFLYRENLMPDIIENAGKKLGTRDNPVHIHHVEGFNRNPFNVQLTFADQNLAEGRNRISLNATFNNLLKQEKAKAGNDSTGILNYTRKKQALTKFYDSLGPDIATQVGKKEVGTRTPLVDMLKKSNIQMKPDVKQRAMTLGAAGDVELAKQLLTEDFQKLKNAARLYGPAAGKIAQTGLRGAGAVIPFETLFLGDYQQQGFSPQEMALNVGTLGVGTIFKDIKEKADYVKSKGLGDELQSAFRKQTISQQARPTLGGAEGMYQEQPLTDDEQRALRMFNIDAQNIIDMRRKFQADEYRQTDEAFGMDDPILRTGAMSGGIMRLGFADGPSDPSKRKFMKILGGLASLPVVGKFIKIAEPLAPVASKAVESVPPYFFKLVDKIKNFGNDVTKRFATDDLENVYNYRTSDADYELYENIATGDKRIKVIKGDPDAPGYKEEELILNKGQADEQTGFVPDEYEEYTVRSDFDGKMKDIEEGLDDIEDLIEEVGPENITVKELEDMGYKVDRLGPVIKKKLGIE